MMVIMTIMMVQLAILAHHHQIYTQEQWKHDGIVMVSNKNGNQSIALNLLRVVIKLINKFVAS